LIELPKGQFVALDRLFEGRIENEWASLPEAMFDLPKNHLTYHTYGRGKSSFFPATFKWDMLVP